MKTWRVAGINFEHSHMGDLLRMVHMHPHAEICGICHDDAELMESTLHNFQIPENLVFNDYKACMEQCQPDLVILCPATARHAEWLENIAVYNVPILMEKPFAASLAEADRMITAMEKSGQPWMINWPLRWVASHVTAKRLVDEGAIGTLQEVHYYNGNRGPMYHVADKVETDEAYVAREKTKSWFYKKAEGGGSLLDYLGYGTTLGTWFLNSATPLEVTTVVDEPLGLEVDEHSITVARYATGLSKFETRWGTFTNPWTHQPQPKCGFVLKGDEGTISSYDYEETICVQTESNPAGDDIEVDTLEAPFQDPIQYFIHCLETDTPVEGPLDPKLCRIGQQIVDTARASAEKKATVKLLP